MEKEITKALVKKAMNLEETDAAKADAFLLNTMDY